MPFAESGPISIASLASYFSGSYRIADYYRGGPYIDNVSENSWIPTSGQISLSQLRGARRRQNFSSTFNRNVQAGSSGPTGNIYRGYSSSGGYGSVVGGTDITIRGQTFVVTEAWVHQWTIAANHYGIQHSVSLSGPTPNFNISGLTFYGQPLSVSVGSGFSGSSYYEEFSYNNRLPSTGSYVTISIDYYGTEYV